MSAVRGFHPIRATGPPSGIACRHAETSWRSGYIEETDASPRAAAEREIEEETQLVAGDNVRFVRDASPLSAVDAQLGIQWIVHPFLYQITSIGALAEIQLNWEHTSYFF